MHDVDVTTTATDLLASNVRAERNRANLTQQSVARRMRQLGYRWHFQTVGAIERGERPLAAAEVYGLAFALQTTIDALMNSPYEGQYVMLPGGQLIGLPVSRRLAYPPEWASAWDGDEYKPIDMPAPPREES